MSRPIHHSIIGAFILGALALIIGSLIAFSSFSFSKKNYPFIVYITDSINGLDIHSDVKFRGVKIGSVKDILFLQYDKNIKDISIPVVIEIESKFVESRFPEIQEKPFEEVLQVAIKNGLRARIQQSNILTGLLHIDINFLDDPCPPIFRERSKSGLPEIPTVSSNTTQMVNSVSTILQNLSKVDFESISLQLKETSKKIEVGVSAIEFKKINDSLVSATHSADKILSSQELESAIKNAYALTKNANTLSEKLASNINPLSKEFNKTAGELRTTLNEIDKTMRIFQSAMQSPQSTIGQDFSAALEQINDAARSVRALSDYLQRNPNSLLLGKPENE